ncbi:hypothetical protein ACGFIG_22610 [Micromonospora sp. NPDC049048]|uniref:Rv0361 family membrane protein n=1 Tax=Micromonospora sp. NPDC049048 TaxID=3364263 RepID=UPI003717DA66
MQPSPGTPAQPWPQAQAPQNGPPGFGAPPVGAAPAPAAGTPKAVWIAVAVAVGLLILAACGAGLYAVARLTGAWGPSSASDETRIRTLVEEFAVAVDRDDQPAILNLLCAEEAEEIMADDDFDPSQAPPADVPSPRPVTVTDIRVDGSTASATVTRASQPGVTLHFRKENGTWKVCAPAGDTPEPSVSASPTN